MFGGKQKKWQRRVASFLVDRIPYGKLHRYHRYLLENTRNRVDMFLVEIVLQLSQWWPTFVILLLKIRTQWLYLSVYKYIWEGWRGEKMIEQVDVGKDNEQVFAMATRIESESVWQQWTCLFLWCPKAFVASYEFWPRKLTFYVTNK